MKNLWSFCVAPSTAYPDYAHLWWPWNCRVVFNTSWRTRKSTYREDLVRMEKTARISWSWLNEDEVWLPGWSASPAAVHQVRARQRRGACRLQACVGGRQRQLATTSRRRPRGVSGVAGVPNWSYWRLSWRHASYAHRHRALYVRTNCRLLDTACSDVSVASRLYFRSSSDVISQLQGSDNNFITLGSFLIPLVFTFDSFFFINGFR